MNWFFNWLNLKCRSAYDADERRDILSVSTKRSQSKYLSSPGEIEVGSITLERERALRFHVFQATGGRIVETQRYDHNHDRNTTGLYVITSDQDFGRELDKIITMESLKRS
jgi:hypothetical protein